MLNIHTSLSDATARPTAGLAISMAQLFCALIGRQSSRQTGLGLGQEHAPVAWTHVHAASTNHSTTRRCQTTPT